MYKTNISIRELGNAIQNYRYILSVDWYTHVMLYKYKPNRHEISEKNLLSSLY